MNEEHAALCSSPEWARYLADVVLPAVLDRGSSGGSVGGALGDQVLEIGPGYGAATEQLVRATPRLTAIEVDERLAARLAERFPAVTVVAGSGTALPFPAARFTAVVCFTVLHHLSSVPAQDALFAEAGRVLVPGGLFAGSDGIANPQLRGLHVGDTYLPVDPWTLPDRLRRAGLVDVDVRVLPSGERFTFTASAPGRT